MAKKVRTFLRAQVSKEILTPIIIVAMCKAKLGQMLVDSSGRDLAMVDNLADQNNISTDDLWTRWFEDRTRGFTPSMTIPRA